MDDDGGVGREADGHVRREDEGLRRCRSTPTAATDFPSVLLASVPSTTQPGPNRRLAALSGEAADDWSDVIRRTPALQTRGTIPFKLLAFGRKDDRVPRLGCRQIFPTCCTLA